MENKVFKSSKKQPIKFKGYNYIGRHVDYEDVAFYVRSLGKDNYELMEAKLAKVKNKYMLAAGTTIKVIDSFMYNTLLAQIEDVKFDDKESFIKYVFGNSFSGDSTINEKEFIEKYSAKVPSAIKTLDDYKKYTNDGFEVLYCSRSINERKFETFSVVLVKNIEYDFFGIKRKYTIFKPITYMTNPSYVNKSGNIRFREFPLSDINVIHDILNTK